MERAKYIGLMKNVLVFGASRGLGCALTQEIYKQFPECRFLLIARTTNDVIPEHVGRWAQMDLSRPSSQASACEEMIVFQPSHVIYAAGGGPYGLFEAKAIDSHLWATEVNYLAVLRILHFALQARKKMPGLKQFAVVGSAVAGKAPDPMASSYAAAKHALRGLIGSVALEKPWFDVKLYEPGYMDTDLLPKNSWPRTKGIVSSPNDEAKKMLHFLQAKTTWDGGLA